MSRSSYNTTLMHESCDTRTSQNKPNVHRIYNSDEELGHFCGVDDIDINKKSHKKSNSALYKIKTMFNCLNTKSNDSKPRKPSSKNAKSKRNSRKRQTLTPAPINTKAAHIHRKLLWRPSLQTILNDELLLSTLIKFMQKQYNSENILFLISIKQLNYKSMDDIDTEIISIYNRYIVASAQYQINVSYQCLLGVMAKQEHLIHITIDEKRSMFNDCANEIKYLIKSSILPSFYRSLLFRSVAKTPKYHHKTTSYNNHLSPDSCSPYDYSPSSSLNTPPIKLEMSSSSYSSIECC